MIQLYYTKKYKTCNHYSFFIFQPSVFIKKIRIITEKIRLKLKNESYKAKNPASFETGFRFGGDTRI